MNYSSKYGLQPADRIIEPIFQTGISKHHAIYLGRDQNGVEWVSENYKFKGVRCVRAVDYFKNDQGFHITKFQGAWGERVSAVKRALSLLGKPYDLIDFNCEHYAEYVQNGIAKSNQVDTVVEVVKTAVVVVLGIGIINYLVNE